MIRGLKHNRHLLVGSPHKVVVLTDHENLAHYRHLQKINRRVARYLHTLADFDLELRHIPGSTNKADALSRRPDHDDGSQDNEELITLPDSLFARALTIGKEEKQIREQQQEDKSLFDEWKKVHQCEEEDGILFRKGALVVTSGKEIHQSLLQRYHDGPTAGHPGVWKTWQALQQDYWWPTMKAFVKAYIAGCAVCQQNKTVTQRNQPPLQPIGSETKPLPFATMLVDFVVKLPLSKGSDSILTIMDQGCTKAVILVPCREDMGAEAVAELFKERVFPYTGILTKLISDHDTRFTSSWFKELCRALGIDQNMSTTYYPQTDGQSEHTNQTMEGLLRIFCNHQADNWTEWLAVVQYIINSQPSSTTKKVPYKLWMGHIP